jgi:isochorismate hydrolase
VLAVVLAMWREAAALAAHQPDIARSAILVVDMQNDFVHLDGGFPT